MGVDPRYLSGRVPEFEVFRGGGFKTYSVFTPNPGEIQFDDLIFQLGWFNHQLETDWSSLILVCLVGDVSMDSTMELVHLEPPFGEYVSIGFSFLSSRGLSRLEVPRKNSRKSLYLEVPWTMLFLVKTGVMYYKQYILEFGKMKSKQICLKQTIVLSKQIFSEIPFTTCGRIRQFLVPVRNIGNLVSNRYYEYLLACNKKLLVVSNSFYLHPYLGKIPILTIYDIFQTAGNHQLENKIGRSEQDK